MYSDTHPQINASGQVVWQGQYSGVGTDYEIFLYHGTSTVQLTNNSYHDEFPKINDSGDVVWEGVVGPDWEIFLAKFCLPTQATPTLVSPSNGATGVSLAPVLDWGDVFGATSYDVQVSLYSTFTVVLRSATVTASQWTVSPALNATTTYYWRVRAKNACGTSLWSSIRYFKTGFVK